MSLGAAIAVGAVLGLALGIVVAVTTDLAGQVSAVDLVRAGSEAVGGKGGGGRPDMAQAGGPDGSRADAALQAIEDRLNAA
jgi:alanyl-tRNA synthetase